MGVSNVIVTFQDVYPMWSDPDDTVSDPTTKMAIDKWVEIKIETWPASVLKERYPWRRWFSEVLARPFRFGVPDHELGIWTHYYMEDFYTMSLRRAFFKADEVANTLSNRMVRDPEYRP